MFLHLPLDIHAEKLVTTSRQLSESLGACLVFRDQDHHSAVLSSCLWRWKCANITTLSDEVHAL